MKKVEVKICGLTNTDDAMAAFDFGADYLGFILYALSPRGIDTAKLARVVDKIDKSARVVGVFVNSSRAEIEKVARDCGLHAVQLHGDEDPSDFTDMPVTVWRAVKQQDGIFTPLPEKWRADRYVIDAVAPELYGGTGIEVDWHDTAGFARAYPVMLAGGLTPDNVTDAIRIVEPLGVDVASGIEVEPGKKDHGKMKRFIEAAKGQEKQMT